MKKGFFYGLVLMFVCGIFSFAYAQDPAMMTGDSSSWLEDLKENNPEEYKKEIARQAHSKKITAIVASMRNYEITKKEAKAQLKPLVEQEINMGERLAQIDQEIEQIEARLKVLKAQKADPDSIVDEQINNYLGIF